MTTKKLPDDAATDREIAEWEKRVFYHDADRLRQDRLIARIRYEERRADRADEDAATVVLDTLLIEKLTGRIEGLLAEVAAMRPVVEAAMEWATIGGEEPAHESDRKVDKLDDAVRRLAEIRKANA